VKDVAGLPGPAGYPYLPGNDREAGLVCAGPLLAMGTGVREQAGERGARSEQTDQGPARGWCRAAPDAVLAGAPGRASKTGQR
jgi:hypothetical protein